MNAEFEIVGYSLDVYFGGKYYGCQILEEPDREHYGYKGRQEMVLQENWQYRNKKLKAGTKVITELVPVCGKLKGDFKEKVQTLENSRVTYNYK